MIIWLRSRPHDNTWLYLQIKNSIERDVGLVDHCDFVKELLEFLDFLYSRKEQVHQMFDVYIQFFRAAQKVEFITSYFMWLKWLKKTVAELALLLPFSSDVKVKKIQREKMTVTRFLNGLLP